MAAEDDDDAAAGSSMSTVGAGEPRTVSAREWSDLMACATLTRMRTHRHR